MRHRLKSRSLGLLEYLQLRDSTSFSNAQEWTELLSLGVLLDDHLRNRLPNAIPACSTCINRQDLTAQACRLQTLRAALGPPDEVYNPLRGSIRSELPGCEGLLVWARSSIARVVAWTVSIPDALQTQLMVPHHLHDSALLLKQPSCVHEARGSLH